MFQQPFGTLTVTQVQTTSGKEKLMMQRKNNTRILVDYKQTEVEDGQDAYMFDNKLIIIVHWGCYTKDDFEATFKNILMLRMGLMRSGLCITVKFGNYQWGMVNTLPGIMGTFNEPEKPFDRITFIFADSATGNIMGYRDFMLNKTTAEFLRTANKQSYRFFADSNAKRASYATVKELISDWQVVAAQDLQSMQNIDYERMATCPGVFGMNADVGNNSNFFQV